MSSLTDFIVRDLPRRVLERGVGVIVLLTASYFFLHESIFVEVIVTLGIVEFYIGFLLPTLQAIGVAGKGTQEGRISLFLLILVPAISAIVFFSSHWPSSLLAVFVILLSPWILEAKIILEKKDVAKGIKVDTMGPLLAALGAAAVLAMCHFIDLIADLGSPMIRHFLLMIAQGTFLGWPKIKISLKKLNFNIKEIFLSVGGVEFSVLIMGVRMSLLKMIALLPEGALMVKIIMLVYEPLASCFGMLLRFLHSEAKFLGELYAERSIWFFASQVATLVFLLAVITLSRKDFLIVGFVIAYLLLAASLTLHFIHSSSQAKTMVIFFQISSILACVFLRFELSAWLISLLVIAAFYTLHQDLQSNKNKASKA